MKQVLAVDLGGTKTAMALVDASGRLSEKRKNPAAPFDATIRQIVNECAACGPDAIAAVGVIVPGIYEPGTGNAWAPNLWGLDFQPLRAALECQLNVPVAIGSDRTGSVLAEQWLGVARWKRHVLFVAVGTGIGVGIVCDGRPVEGAHGIAGAAGWMVVGSPWKPEFAACGGWESQAAGPALARLGGMESAEAVVAAARAGDRHALEAVMQVADSLALGIAGLIAILDPEIVVLGGGLMQASDLMLDRIRRQTLCWTQPIAGKVVRVEKTALGEDAGLFGAARLAWMHLGL
jgi:glucokinase